MERLPFQDGRPSDAVPLPVVGGPIKECGRSIWRRRRQTDSGQPSISRARRRRGSTGPHRAEADDPDQSGTTLFLPQPFVEPSHEEEARAGWRPHALSRARLRPAYSVRAWALMRLRNNTTRFETLLDSKAVVLTQLSYPLCVPRWPFLVKLPLSGALRPCSI